MAVSYVQDNFLVINQDRLSIPVLLLERGLDFNGVGRPKLC